MESAEYGGCVDESLCRERPWNRLLVPETLVRTRFIVEAHALGDDAPEVILIEDEDMVEQLTGQQLIYSTGAHDPHVAYLRPHVESYFATDLGRFESRGPRNQVLTRFCS